MVLANSPVLRRGSADVEAARGLALQAGLYPNPTVGYQGDQIQPRNPNGPAGQQGVFLQQLIKTGGKLELARAAAGMDALSAEAALRQAQVDLAARVREGYFAVLVARENVRVSRMLTDLADEVFRIQVQQVKGGQAAAYEPLQLHVFAVQARQLLLQARNRYTYSWKRLAASLGLPDLPPTELAGRADAAVPQFDFDNAREYLLASHTALRTAENTILKARYHLRLAEVTRLPDLQFNSYYQHDNTAGLFQFGVQLGVDVPLWDRNQGNIRAAQAQLARAEHDLTATRNDLIRQLAEAFERYQNTRVLVSDYRDKILGSQVRVYRGIRDRYQQEPDKITYADIVNAQQNLSGAITTYLNLLASQWAAVVDVAQILQIDDLYPCGPESPSMRPGPESPYAPSPQVLPPPPPAGLSRDGQ